MNPSILNTEIQEFIDHNLTTEVTNLILKGVPFALVDTKAIIEQIEAKKRCEKKLPTWFNTSRIYYPNKLNIEQTSSEVTAKYKANIISGASIIDVTGGFGVDCFYFSKQFQEVTHCEINDELSKIVAYNYEQLQIKNIKTLFGNGINYLKQSNTKYDWIYLDPSRRHQSKGKVFFLQDCLPNVPKHLNLLFKASNNILIKTSPLLDISVGIRALKFVKTIHIVAVNNEVKELLWVLEQGFTGDITIKTINIKNDTTENFDFYIKDEKKFEPPYNLPLTYLYEPNAAILKAGAFNSLAHKLAVFKLHKHTHLYTSEIALDFPGRCFKIEKTLNFNSKTLKKEKILKANISTRNFPIRAEVIKKKFKIQDGGSVYLFFTTDLNDHKIVIVTSKIK